MLKDVSDAAKRFYERLRTTERTENLNIPHSKVYYARWAIYEDTGIMYSVDHVNIAMWLEGYLPPRDVTNIPDWYVKKYMGGKKPNMEELRAEVQRKYLEKNKLALP